MIRRRSSLIGWSAADQLVDQWHELVIDALKPSYEHHEGPHDKSTVVSETLLILRRFRRR